MRIIPILAAILLGSTAVAAEEAPTAAPEGVAKGEPNHDGTEAAMPELPPGHPPVPGFPEAHRDSTTEPAQHGAAAEGHGEAQHAGAGHAHSTPDVIIHHVSDDLEWEFEIPKVFSPNAEDPDSKAWKLHLGDIFKSWIIVRTPGACEMPVTGPLVAAPSLGKWLNGCWDLRPTKAVFMMWISAALLLFFVGVFSHKDKEKLVPKGKAAHIIESVVLFIRDEIAVKNIGKEEAGRYMPYLTTAFFFILVMNWLGLVPSFGSATGALGVTCALAIMTFVLTQIASIRSAGLGGFLSHLTGGTPWPMWPIMIPVEILGLFTKPFALMVRLFANMLAGHMVLFFILGLIFMLTAWMAPISVAIGVALYFLEIFVGLLQAYIFTMLSALFIGLGVQMGHHGHDEHHDKESAHAH